MELDENLGGTLYVPGFGGGARAPEFLSGFPQPVSVLDVRGCVTADDFERRIHECLASQKPSVLAGHSVGGYLALDALASFPADANGLEKLVLFGMGTKVEPGPVLRTIVKWPTPLVYLFLFMYLLAAPYFFLREGAAAMQRFGLVRNLRYLGVGKAAASCRETLFRLAVPASRNVGVDTEIVALRGDILVDDDDVKRLHERLPGSRIRWIEAPGIHLTTGLLDKHYSYADNRPAA